MREELPARRQSLAFDFQFEGFQFTATISRYADGRVAEIFLDMDRKRGQGLDGMAHDLATVASLALQYGCPLEKIRSTLARLDDDQPAGPLGQAFEYFAAIR